MKNHVLWRLHPAARGKRPGRGENKSRVRSRPLSSWKNCGYGADTKSKILSESTRWGKCGEHPRNRNRLIRHYQRIKRFVLYPEPVLKSQNPHKSAKSQINHNILWVLTTSVDGQSWKTLVQAVSISWSFLIYKDGMFVAISQNGYMTTSSDGETWTEPVQIKNESGSSVTSWIQDMIAVS